MHKKPCAQNIFPKFRVQLSLSQKNIVGSANSALVVFDYPRINSDGASGTCEINLDSGHRSFVARIRTSHGRDSWSTHAGHLVPVFSRDSGHRSDGWSRYIRSLLPHLAMPSFRRVTCRVIIELGNLPLFDRISVTPPDEKHWNDCAAWNCLYEFALEGWSK
jgi:hypothetical protein